MTLYIVREVSFSLKGQIFNSQYQLKQPGYIPTVGGAGGEDREGPERSDHLKEIEGKELSSDG